MPDPARLSDLVGCLPGGGRREGEDVLIADVTHDSRAVGPGSLFVAIPGERHDGHDYVDRAIAGGAAAVIVEHEVVGSNQIVVPDARAALPWAAAAVYGDPSLRLSVVGVTGTNGKTTVTHMLEQIVVTAGRTAAIVGTVGARIGAADRAVARTTPEASDLQRLLADMVIAGVDVAAIEVSSHALSLHRVDAIRFRVAAFTNLMRDHLDFHGDMEEYFAAKASLFTTDRADHAVIAVDEEWGRRIATATDVPVTTVAIGRSADVAAVSVTESIAGSSFVIVTQGRRIPIELPVPGRFNVENALVAAAIALELGTDDISIARGLSSVGTIPGRFERVESGRDFGIVVDYAHTPDAIEAVVDSALRVCQGRVIIVFGAGGDRDQEKRPAMGRAASRADIAILTSDNPRTEIPVAIMAAVRSGIPTDTSIIEEPDRRRAIKIALEAADPGDLVLVLGKGHETGQDIDGIVEPFDDRVVVLEELQRMSEAGS
ncbi:MAG: UDP-N-acetylmuramoyl-L-alanyl-D-glutamate--2,6-diaminopimelate ligase [Actinomycetota bacterium]|nr:UDP-N-acetylmuramoyl-L-alanyl-D-glutamate--2,6-diaminopimelate ligase [Actinomycetota bacterium]